MAAIEEALEYGQRVQKERNDPQMNLFDTGDSKPAINVPLLPEIQEWEEKQRLAFEKESLGFYISGHPLKGLEAVLEKFTNVNAMSVKESSDGTMVRIGGIVIATKVIKTKKGDLMAFVTLEDMHGSVEIIVFSNLYAVAEPMLFEDNAILVQGRLQKDEQSIRVIAEDIIPIDKAEEAWTASIHLHLDVSRTDRETLLNLQDILLRYPGSCRTFLHLRDSQGADTVISVSEQIKLQPGPHLTRDVNRFLGYDAVETMCNTGVSLASNNSMKRNGGRGSRRYNGR